MLSPVQFKYHLYAFLLLGLLHEWNSEIIIHELIIFGEVNHFKLCSISIMGNRKKTPINLFQNYR